MKISNGSNQVFSKFSFALNSLNTHQNEAENISALIIHFVDVRIRIGRFGVILSSLEKQSNLSQIINWCLIYTDGQI